MLVLVFRTRTTNTNHDLARLASETCLKRLYQSFVDTLLPLELKFDIRSPSRILSCREWGLLEVRRELV
jgi:hypothetical protein